jgi:hypothetical protein
VVVPNVGGQVHVGQQQVNLAPQAAAAGMGPPDPAGQAGVPGRGRVLAPRIGEPWLTRAAEPARSVAGFAPKRPWPTPAVEAGPPGRLPWSSRHLPLSPGAGLSPVGTRLGVAIPSQGAGRSSPAGSGRDQRGEEASGLFGCLV